MIEIGIATVNQKPTDDGDGDDSKAQSINQSRTIQLSGWLVDYLIISFGRRDRLQQKPSAGSCVH